MKRRNNTRLTFDKLSVEQAGRIGCLEPLTNLKNTELNEFYKLAWLTFESDGTTHRFELNVNGGITGAAIRYEAETVLKELIANGRITSLRSMMHGICIEFGFQPKMGFCETSLDLAFEVLSRLTLPKAEILSILKSLRIKRQTEILYKGFWVDYSSYLCSSHPVFKK